MSRKARVLYLVLRQVMRVQPRHSAMHRCVLACKQIWTPMLDRSGSLHFGRATSRSLQYMPALQFCVSCATQVNQPGARWREVCSEKNPEYIERSRDASELHAAARRIIPALRIFQFCLNYVMPYSIRSTYCAAEREFELRTCDRHCARNIASPARRKSPKLHRAVDMV